MDARSADAEVSPIINFYLCLLRKQSLRMLVERMMLIREKLKEKLRIQGTPGSWEHLTAQSGTRSFIGLLRMYPIILFCCKAWAGGHLGCVHPSR